MVDPVNEEYEKLPAFVKDCPLVFDWCEYKGEIYFGQLNVPRSLTSKRAMIDLSYCATRALNYNIMKTVQWNKSKFNLNPTHLN